MEHISVVAVAEQDIAVERISAAVVVVVQKFAVVVAFVKQMFVVVEGRFVGVADMELFAADIDIEKIAVVF